MKTQPLNTNTDVNVAPCYADTSVFVYLQEELRNCFVFKKRTTWTDNAFLNLFKLAVD